MSEDKFLIVEDMDIVLKVPESEISEAVAFFKEAKGIWVEVFYPETAALFKDKSKYYEKEFQEWKAKQKEKEKEIEKVCREAGLEGMEWLFDKIEQKEGKVILRGWVISSHNASYNIMKALAERGWKVTAGRQLPHAFEMGKDRMKFTYCEGDLTLEIWEKRR